MQRREFVMASGSLLAASGVHMPVHAATPPAPALTGIPAGLHVLNRATFAALLNQSFNVYASKRGVTMQLIEVHDDKARAGAQQFTLVFAADAGTTLGSGTYEVENAMLGMTSMYLQQAGAGAQGALYLAHFNLLS